MPTARIDATYMHPELLARINIIFPVFASY